jgi:hypothetical protein
MMRAEQLDALVNQADSGQVRLWGRAPPVPLLICCSVQGGLGNEKTHGVLEVTADENTKTRHRTTIGAKKRQIQVLFTRDAKAVGHDGRKSMPKVRVHVRPL